MSSSNPIKLLPRACVCGEKEDLRRCSGCRVVYYCEHKHRLIDHIFHWSACYKAKEARRILEKERKALWDMVDDGSVPNDLFKDGIGYFGAVPLTEPYILAKYQLANTLLLSFGGPGGRVDAVQAALDCFLRMFRLNRGDRKHVRLVIPALFIRLNKDQEAYDFIKWCASTGDPAYFEWDDWGQYGWDNDLDFLQVKDADAFEESKNWVSEHRSDTSPMLALTLIKVRILLDLLATLNTTRAFQGSVPKEIIELICEQLVGGIVQARSEIIRGRVEDMACHIETIKAQIMGLYKLMNEYNPHVWRLMLSDPYAAAASGPFSYPFTSEETACMAIEESMASWLETPRSLDVMRSVSQAASTRHEKRGCYECGT
ncbi:hypothetical protein BHE90_003542 [Fusarium euwallaceae]|uniref:Suppressor of anucleate metulae protein B n=1 Tax=Fusarium euwallaceae TaxID=1147111 RepID=A0A430M1R3_9HYPO|nr:hypothetical protein BHE90_003542 [Fusarium euwallaceae]